MKTQQIREVIVSKIKSIPDVDKIYYRRASDSVRSDLYVVYTFEQVMMDDSDLDEIKLVIDIWGRMANTAVVDDVADSVDDLLNMANEPCNDTYPTFYRYDRRIVDDNDKDVYRTQLRFMVRNIQK